MKQSETHEPVAVLQVRKRSHHVTRDDIEARALCDIRERHENVPLVLCDAISLILGVQRELAAGRGGLRLYGNDRSTI